MIQHGLPNGLLLDLVENLMVTDPAPTRLGHERLTPAGRPPHASVVHGLERDLEHRRDTLTSPARRQRGHRPQPKGLLRRRRQLPCVPHQLTHAGINDPNTYRFGSIRARNTILLRFLAGRDECDGYTACNESDIASATRPPVIGYTDLWSDTVGSLVDKIVGNSGPMSPKTQVIEFNVTLGP
ncbi:hypothetical protein IM697_19510 [Streptomyces ferrugineus]|uniref:Uncharacterized protein n=1 Tax=Streptomyces ferrugineus TaxID=1413221 RepID=A0A7M2SY04_9ACTN|nr:hypothetical protein [Streptomyces ferrugineus]QOV40398.1 hypothetical protein IM697_19510 [Streptomyces ferrugineus]